MCGLFYVAVFTASAAIAIGLIAWAIWTFGGIAMVLVFICVFILGGLFAAMDERHLDAQRAKTMEDK